MSKKYEQTQASLRFLAEEIDRIHAALRGYGSIPDPSLFAQRGDVEEVMAALGGLRGVVDVLAGRVALLEGAHLFSTERAADGQWVDRPTHRLDAQP